MSRSIQHTPGPWSADLHFIVAPDPAGIHPDIYLAEIVESDEEGRLATPREQYGNQVLMTAAPTLLAAARVALPELEEFYPDPNSPGIRALKFAIAKATGGRVKSPTRRT